MLWWHYLIIFIAGSLVGFINTLAGSGSLISLPLLISFGMPATLANGTNRIGILLHSAFAIGKFKKNNYLDLKQCGWIILPVALGSVAGALVAVDISDQLMNRIIGGLMVVMFFVILLNPKKWLIEHSIDGKMKATPLKFLIFLAVGFYGGFIQAGIGFILLAVMVLGVGVNLLAANGLKILVTLSLSVVALVVFIAYNQVDFKAGLTLGLGNILGTWIATKLAFKHGIQFVRWVLLACVFVFAVKFVLIDLNLV